MLTAKRCDDQECKVDGGTEAYHPTSSSNKTCEAEGEALPPGSDTATLAEAPAKSIGSDPDHCKSVEAVAQLSRSVVSLSLIARGVHLFSCFGVPVECRPGYIKIWTYSNLAVTLFQKAKCGPAALIHVRDASNNVAIGCLEQYGIGRGTAFVNVADSLDVCAVNLHPQPGVESLPTSDVVAMQLT